MKGLRQQDGFVLTAKLKPALALFFCFFKSLTNRNPSKWNARTESFARMVVLRLSSLLPKQRDREAEWYG